MSNEAKAAAPVATNPDNKFVPEEAAGTLGAIPPKSPIEIKKGQIAYIKGELANQRKAGAPAFMTELYEKQIASLEAELVSLFKSEWEDRVKDIVNKDTEKYHGLFLESGLEGDIVIRVSRIIKDDLVVGCSMRVTIGNKAKATTTSDGTSNKGGGAQPLTVDGVTYPSASKAKEALLPGSGSLNRKNIISKLRTAKHSVDE